MGVVWGKQPLHPKPVSRIRFLGLAAALSISAATPALGASSRVAGARAYHPDAGPVVLGARSAAWTEDASNGRTRVIVGRAGRAAQARLISPPRSFGGQRVRRDAIFATPFLAGGQGGLVLEARWLLSPDPKYGVSTYYRETFAGKDAAALRAQAGPCPVPQADTSRAVDADGGDAALRAPGCDQAEVLQLASGTATPLPSNVTGLRLAGAYVAWLENPQGAPAGATLAVADRAGNVIYRVKPSPDGSTIFDFDLDSDGALAVLLGSQGPAVVAVASPGDPQLRPVSLPASLTPTAVRAAHGRLAILGVAGSRFADVASHARVVIVDRGTGAQHVVTQAADGREAGKLLGFDGERVGFVHATCDTSQVVVVNYAADWTSSTPNACPLRLTRRLRVDRVDQAVRVAFSCAGFNVNCQGNLTITARVGGRSRVIAETDQASNEEVVNGHASLPLSATGRRLLRQRHSPVAASVNADIYDGFTPPQRRRTRAKLPVQ